ncbi:ATP-binding domain 1 family member B [Gaeumannomyces tritici R3-111a-1]|uniref:GPN-loop GTPase 2 n=1 Tax=Gaeumannomyces tritici (strain R3-111a-1) TaxID=644352 RepID=J3NS45_GAET3|nr:ATP-binding domain 1 family member B [Gaeumannomyces tritici R3-111a-1]EJT79001.1 ATP-binding domain 1 family member B [Gaeumannomyces tritici R3-111a-1]
MEALDPSRGAGRDGDSLQNLVETLTKPPTRFYLRHTPSTPPRTRTTWPSLPLPPDSTHQASLSAWSAEMPFAQLVVGAPGSGKSTYCYGMHQFMGAIGRMSSVVNLDPANDRTNYPCALDIRNLVTLEEIMSDDKLGPNGGILYALEELEHNMEWLEEGLKELGEDYIIFDCPGQVELYTHHNSLRNIFFRLQKIGYRLVVVHLSDSICLTQPSLYISNLLLALRAMLQMDLPHINVLSKIDKVASYERLPFNLEFYTEVQDLTYLLPELEAENPSLRSEKFARLNRAVANLIQDFGLVGFEVLAVENKKSMMHLLRVLDRASGYVFGGAEGANDSVWQVAMRNEASLMGVQDIQERWIDNKEAYDEMEQREWEEQVRARAEAADAAQAADDDGDAIMDVPRGIPNSGITVTRTKK